MINVNRFSVKSLLTSWGIMFFLMAVLSQTGCVTKKGNVPITSVTTDILDEQNPNYIMVSAHRGAWRNAPENSLKSLRDAIEMGVDIVEADVKMTKDGHLVMMHDGTIDRTTTGTGAVRDYTLKELKQFYLKGPSGETTTYRIPTLDEFLAAAKGKILVDMDHSFGYFNQVVGQLKDHDMVDQTIMNVGYIYLDSLYSRDLELIDSIALNVIIGSGRADVATLVGSYKGRKRTIIHPTFSSDTTAFFQWMPQIREMSLGLWLNALWANHNAGHDDDRAVLRGEPDESWGWLINTGKATIIQSDRPKELIFYLEQKGLRKRK